jgi:hypothetical protein
MRLLHLVCLLTLVSALFADTITMKSGRVIHGTYLGGSPRQVRVEVGDQIQNIDVSDILRIEFGSAAPAQMPPPGDPDRPVMRRREEPPAPPAYVPPPPPASPVPPAPPAYPDSGAAASATVGDMGITLPAGASLVVRMIDGVDSETARPGQTFAGSLDEPVRDANGQELIPRG